MMKRWFKQIGAVILFFGCLRVGALLGNEAAPELLYLQGEVLEVEDLRDPEGSAILTIRDFESGKTLRLFADPYRTQIVKGDQKKTVRDVIGGEKVTLTYRAASDEPDLPEISYLKLQSSYS